MKRLFALISILFTFTPVLASETIVLAVENSWPPFAKRDGTGISRTIIEKAYGYSNRQVEFITVPYARALSMAKSGRVHGAFNVTKQGSTESDFVFGQYPLLKVSASFYYPPKSNLSYSHIAEIPRGTSVAVIIGYEYGNEFEQHKPRLDLVPVASQQQIVKLLRTKRVDMAVMFDDVAEFTLQQMSLPSSAIVKGALNHTSDIYVAFNKSLKDKSVISDLDLGLKSIEQESAYITP